MSFLYEETPSALEELFQDALINNTWNAKDLIGTMKMAVENSFSYLYRLQRNMIRFHQVFYRTRKKDLEMTRDMIDKELTRLDNEINRLLEEHPTDFQTRIRGMIAEKDALVKIEFGDFFLDTSYRVCMNVDFDLTSSVTREAYRVGNFFEQELTFSDILDHPDTFRYFPIFTIDGKTYFDCKYRMLSGGELQIITPFPETFMRGPDYKQIYHETQVMFIDNLFCCTLHATPVALRYYSTSFERVPMDWKAKETLVPEGVNGMYFGFLRITTNKGTDSFYYYMQECHVDGEFFVFEYAEPMYQLIKQASSVEFKILFFHHMKKYQPYNGNPICVDRGQIPLCMIQESENKPYPMPIPEVNTLVLKCVEGSQFLPDANLMVNLNYPNIYRIYDPGVYETTTYMLYYFYEENYALEYTPMHDFYYQYLKTLPSIDMPIEQFVNHLYYGDSLEGIVEEGRILDEDRFREVFRWVFQYYEADQEYGIHDFLLRETWTNYPLNYQTEEMKRFIKKDYLVLKDYAHINRTIGNVHHLYVKNVDLKKRFRRSTYLSFEDGESFFSKYTILPTHASDGLEVVPDNLPNIDYNTMIPIRDFFGFDDKPDLGDHVLLEDDHPRYVFLLKQRPDKKPRDLRVFVDGKYIWDYSTFAKHDSEFLYLPVDVVKEDSYIMIEEMCQYAHLTTVTFANTEEEQTVHLIESREATPYATDLYILDSEGFELPNESFIMTPVINQSSYSIQDEDGVNRLVHADITHMKIQIKDSKYLNQELEIRVHKKMERYRFTMWRRAFPRFTVHGVKSNRQLTHVEIWHNGLLVPENLYRLENYRQFGIYRIQLLKQFEIGDELVIEFSPYTHTTPVRMLRFPETAVTHLEKFLNKPACIDYYDFYVNGKRLGLPHVYRIGQTGVLFKNLHSNHLLEVRERERDDEYFGFENGREKYFYSILDFLYDSFITEEDRIKILEELVQNQKDPRTEIRENTTEEYNIWSENLPDLEEDAKIFYYEDLLPKDFIDPDLLQFDKAYFIVEYPKLADDYLVDYEGQPYLDGDIIFINPDIGVQDDLENTIVMLVGENEIND